MASDDDEEQPISRQVLNMILENTALKEKAFPFITGYIVFNIVILILLIYISVRISIR